VAVIDDATDIEVAVPTNDFEANDDGCQIDPIKEDELLQ